METNSVCPDDGQEQVLQQRNRNQVEWQGSPRSHQRQRSSFHCFSCSKLTVGQCPSSSCLDTGLDLSPSLFSQLAPQSQGLIFGAEWRIAGSGGGDPAPAPRPPVTTRRRPTPTYVPPPRPTTTRRPVVDPPRPTPTRSSTRSTTRSSTSRSRTRTSTTASEEETTSAANVRGSNTSSNAPAPTVDLGVGPAAGFALPASAVDIPAGGFSNLLSLNQAFVQAVAVVAATKKSA